jgi:hypothetical protein
MTFFYWLAGSKTREPGGYATDGVQDDYQQVAIANSTETCHFSVRAMHNADKDNRCLALLNYSIVGKNEWKPTLNLKGGSQCPAIKEASLCESEYQILKTWLKVEEHLIKDPKVIRELRKIMEEIVSEKALQGA